jgi:hypothetical protein
VNAIGGDWSSPMNGLPKTFPLLNKQRRIFDNTSTTTSAASEENKSTCFCLSKEKKDEKTNNDDERVERVCSVVPAAIVDKMISEFFPFVYNYIVQNNFISIWRVPSNVIHTRWLSYAIIEIIRCSI